MKLHKLTLQNFCGIKELTYAFDGQNVAVYGDNATGKTTIVKALTWLLIGKDHTGATELDPAPVDGENQKVHYLETSVEAEFEHKGSKKSYRKVLSEVWRKTRGSKEESFSGYKTEYFIDSVPMKESQYVFEIMNIAQSEKIKILMLPFYFSTMSWKVRREFLVEICGDVTDADVFASNKQLAELPKMLGNHTVDEFLKIAKSKKLEIKREVESLPVRISENENTIPELHKSLNDLQAELESFEKLKADFQAELASVKSNDNKAKRVNELKSNVFAKRAEWLSKQGEFNDKLNSDINTLINELREIQRKKTEYSTEAVRIKSKIDLMLKRRESLLEKHKTVSSRLFNEPGICPTCGQAIPDDKQRQALEEFNQKKSKELEEIINTANAECHKDMIAQAQQELKTIKEKEADCSRTEDNLSVQISDLQARIDRRKYEDTDEYRNLQSEIHDLENSDDSNEQALELNTKISSISESIDKVMTDIASHKAAQKAKERIAELKSQHEKLSDEFLYYEKGEYLCELFIRSKVDLLNERINSKFKTLKFKLFHEQQNGGIAEVCQVLVPCESGLVEYEKANNASRINAGLEIIEVISAHYGVEFPVFVDNAESVTRLYDLPLQVISLIVSENDKKLRFEKI